MRFQHIDILPPLKGYIERIWIFESGAMLPSDDTKVLVPNGRLLLLLPFQNGLVGRKADKVYTAYENKMSLVGMTDIPSAIDTQAVGPVGAIGVEFSPAGAYRVLHLKLNEIKNQVFHLTDILGKVASAIEQKMGELNNPADKVRLLQQFFLTLFTQREEDPLFDYCVRKIKLTKGKISVAQLQHETGYSSRWLNIKFEEKLGLSPKTFNSVIRFQHFYQSIISNPADFWRQKDFYIQYYDESHFYKDFKRFTGMSPAKLIQSKNEFGKLFRISTSDFYNT